VAYLYLVRSMSLPRLRYAIFCGVTLGFVVPVFVMVGARFRVFSVGEWLLFIWPSSILLMATENLGYSPEAFGIVAMSIGANIILYTLVFSLLWSLGWVFQRWRLSLRDGTTI